MFDLNSVIIGFIKILFITLFVFSSITLCLKIKQDMGKVIEFNTFGLSVWNRRWRIFIMIVILIGGLFVFNLEQVHRPKNNLSINTAPTTMGYQEPRTITVKAVIPLDREAAFAKNKKQNEAAKEAFKKLEN